ncbi:MAG: VTC domain-containing protein, partial [Proteobacteria bacterium]|nr:VTC domain-containing protein [Pseudomonadota bacterium]
RFALAPSVTILYHRTAFNAAFYPGLRITFDRMIQCSLATALDNPQHAFVEMIPTNLFIIELKYNATIPEMLLRRFHRLGLQQGTLSKYAMGLEQSFEFHRRPFVRG